jgi:PEP-CTERM motif
MRAKIMIFRFRYLLAGLDYSFIDNLTPANNAVGTITASPATVPLPSTLPLFATGLGVLGLLGWRRKRKAAVAAA